MDEVKERKQRKILICVIAVLFVVAVGLGVGIGINKNNVQPENEGVISEDEDKSEEEDTIGGEVDVSELSESERLFYFYDEELEKTETKVEGLFAEEPVDVDAIKKIYIDYYNSYIREGAPILADGFLSSGVEKFIDHSMEKEALSLLTSVDLDSLYEVDKCLYYSDIISLAKKISEDDVAQRYITIAASMKDSGEPACNDLNKYLNEE